MRPHEIWALSLQPHLLLSLSPCVHFPYARPTPASGHLHLLALALSQVFALVASFRRHFPGPPYLKCSFHPFCLFVLHGTEHLPTHHILYMLLLCTLCGPCISLTALCGQGLCAFSTAAPRSLAQCPARAGRSIHVSWMDGLQSHHDSEH